MSTSNFYYGVGMVFALVAACLVKWVDWLPAIPFAYGAVWFGALAVKWEREG